MKSILTLIIALGLGTGLIRAQELPQTASVNPPTESAFQQKAPDKVYLKSGEVISGYLVNQDPGKSVTYFLTDGTTRTIPIDNIKRTKRNIDKGYNLEYTHKGWKGTVGFEYNRGTYLPSYYGYQAKSSDHVGIYGIYGYQIHPMFYAGAGAELQWFYAGYFLTDDPFCTFPLFVDIRFTPVKYRFTPLVDIKIGGFVGAMQGFYSNFSGGLRIAIDQKCGINVTVGYTVQHAKKLYGLPDSMMADYIASIYKKKLDGISIHFGVDF